jgi:hypothetical protein
MSRETWTTPHDAEWPRMASVHDTGSGERERPERLLAVNSRRLLPGSDIGRRAFQFLGSISDDGR